MIITKKDNDEIFDGVLFRSLVTIIFKRKGHLTNEVYDDYQIPISDKSMQLALIINYFTT